MAVPLVPQAGASARQSGFVAAMIKDAATNTGFAIMTPGSTDVSVDLQLIDKDGNLLATATVTIPPMGHLARFFNDIPWQPEPGITLDLSAFEGLIKGATTGGRIAATVIQAQTSEFVTMPVGSPPPVTITVTSAADGGPGTLRQALFFANPGDIITFDPEVFPPNLPTTITLATGLPELSQGSLTIDASNAGVILDGSEITDPEFQYGLHILSDSNTIRGLQIRGFPFAGIVLERGANRNLIGGDRGIGSGPLGQGNLIGGNRNFGIGLWDEGTSFNTIQGNSIVRNPQDGINCFGASYNLIRDNIIGLNGAGISLAFAPDGHNTVTANIIGTDASGETPLGNQWGVLVDHTGYNVIGPGNLIAHNEMGITFWEDTPFNTITQNSIRNNRGLGIEVIRPGDARRAGPVILDYDLQAGSMTGLACANCIVEIFSDSNDEGGTYEGQTEADGTDFFTFSKGVAFTGPHLTTYATDPGGSTTQFSRPTQGPSGMLALQEGNALAKHRLQSYSSKDLADNRIGINYAGAGMWPDLAGLDNTLDNVTGLGMKRVDTQLYEIEPPIDWSVPELNFPPEFDRFVDDLVENGVAMNYMLLFWDKAGHALGEELPTPRFKTEPEIEDFIEYARLVVRHFKGRIQYYTIWNEPDACGGPINNCIEPLDYQNLAEQMIPVIREEDPQAKVVSGPNVLFFAQDQLFTLLSSDVVQLFDVISWHPLYDAAPNIAFQADYYYDYPSIIREIKDTASASGFQGEYWGSEMTWNSKETCPGCEFEIQDTDVQVAKYYARGIVIQLGLDVGVGLAGSGTNPSSPASYPTVRNMATVMAGTRPDSISVEIESAAANITSYGFTLPNGDRLFTLWNDDAAVDDDPGTASTLTFSDLL